MNPIDEYEVIYSHAGVAELAEKAKELGLQFKIGGMPFGAPHSVHLATLGLPPRQPSEMAGSTQP